MYARMRGKKTPAQRGLAYVEAFRQICLTTKGCAVDSTLILAETRLSPTPAKQMHDAAFIFLP